MPRDSLAVRSKKQKAQLLIRQRKLNAAKRLYAEICNSNLRDAEAWFMLGALNGELGLADETIECCRKAIKLQPEYVGAYYNMARALLGRGKPQEAIKICRKAISVQGDYPQIYITLGLAYAALDKHDAAIDSFRNSIKLDPHLAEAYLNLGLSLKAAGKTTEAVNQFQTAVRLMPDDIRAHQQLITSFRSMDKFEEALTCYLNLIRLQPESAILHHDIGATLVAVGRGEEAIYYYDKAIQLDPQLASAYLGLGEVCLHKHQMDGLRRIARRMHEHLPGHPYEQLLLAKLERREGRLEEASRRLTAVTQHEPDAGSSAKIQDELGHILDSMGQYQEAMKSFAKAQNAYAKSVNTSDQIKKQPFYEAISINRNWFVPDNVASWARQQMNDGMPVPAYIVGFPRSGTTLVEQILAAHSKVVVSDERPILVTLLNQMPGLLGLQAPYPDILNQLDETHLSALRKRYWELCEESVDLHAKNKTFIDKLPLNSIHLGFIHRIFPEAKILVALRDPRDVCLSCYIQTFQLNAAMIQFTELESTARAYSAVMSLLTHYRNVLKLDVLECRYEDIVTDIEFSARKILSFLALNWEERILSFYQFKRKRTITTPSYEGVATPVYSRAVGRWNNYKNEMRPVLPILQPYIKLFGYDEE